MAYGLLNSLFMRKPMVNCICSFYKMNNNKNHDSFFNELLQKSKFLYLNNYKLMVTRHFSNEDDCAGKPIKCLAAVKYSKDVPFEIDEIEVEPPKKHEVRIKIVASGICHTDVYNFGDFLNEGSFPVIRGHEGAGFVESVGECVERFKKGDHVMPIYMPRCGECKLCKSGKTNLCSKLAATQGKGVLADGTSRFKCDGKIIKHFMGTSSFSQYTVVSEYSLCKIDKGAPLEKVCILGCGIPTGLGAALNTAKVTKDSICAVFGLGTVGMAAIMGCSMAGAKKVFGIDINSKKAEMAKQFGMTDFINPSELVGGGSGNCGDKLVQKLKKAAGGGGFDYTLECVGKVDIMRTALECTHDGWGVSVIVGVDPSPALVQTLPAQLLLGRKWTGSPFGDWCVGDIAELVTKYMNKELMVDEFITHTLPLRDINKAFKLMMDGKCLKTVVLLHDKE